VAPVDEGCQLDAARAPVVEERLDRGAGGPAGEEDVVDEHHGAGAQVEVEVRGVDDRRLGPLADIVAVEGDVDVPQRHLVAGELADERMQAAGDDRAAGVDADQCQARGPGVLLDDLVRDPHQGAAQVVTVEHDLL
jgi:hypothetical protein